MGKRGRAMDDLSRTEVESLQSLLPKLRDLILEAHRKAATAVNSLQVATTCKIKRLPIEQEQRGSERIASSSIFSNSQTREDQFFVAEVTGAENCRGGLTDAIAY